ncbi:hypothetical protein BH10PSE18_BH10PSE18_21840 [soil metagenome]
MQIEASSIPLLPRMIERTHLLSFVSRHTLALPASSTLKEVNLKAAMLRRSLGVTVRRQGYLSPAALRIVTLLRSRGEALFAGTAAAP